MNLRKNALLILGSAALIAALTLTIPADQSQVRKGIFTPEQYAMVTEEDAQMLAENQNVQLDFSMSVTERHQEKIQEYMRTHPETTDEETIEIFQRLHDEAVIEVMESGNFPEDYDPNQPERNKLADVMPVVTEDMTGEELEGTKRTQKKIYIDFLCREERERRQSVGLDASDEAMGRFWDEMWAYVLESCEVSPDGSTLLLLEPDSVPAEMINTMNLLQKNEENVALLIAQENTALPAWSTHSQKQNS